MTAATATASHDAGSLIATNAAQTSAPSAAKVQDPRPRSIRGKAAMHTA